MAVRRALVTAPLAILVAVAAHLIGFGAGHALGGPDSGRILAVGLGGSLCLALGALVWLALTGHDAGRGERLLLALLPARGGVASAAVLGLFGFAALACGEVIEGHSPFGSWQTALALALAAVLVALAARGLIRWLAAAGAALSSTFSVPVRRRALPLFAFANEHRPVGPTSPARGVRRGRAPPQFA